MSFKRTFTEKIEERLSRKPLLLVYDPSRRYRQLIQEMDNGKTRVVDVESSTLEAREKAVSLWKEMVADQQLRMIIYVPYEMPREVHEQQADPLAAFASLGGRFPEPGVSAEEYKSLAQLAFPGYGEKIDRLFENGEPSVQAIEALAGGESYPTLQSVFGTSSPAEVIISLLTDEGGRVEGIMTQEAGRSETAQMLTSSLGLDLGVENGDLQTLREKLWRYILFSEFLLDLPDQPPAGLKSIPSAGKEHRQLVFHICGKLRDAYSTRQAYIDAADRVEQELDLGAKMRGVYRLGDVDTFSFENAAAMKHAVDSLTSGDIDEASQAAANARESIWYREDYLLSQSWRIIELAARLLQSLIRAETVLKEKSAGGPTDYYLHYGSAADRGFREFIQSFRALSDEEPYGVELGPIEEKVGEFYRRWIANLAEVTVESARREGWPFPGLLSQEQIFEKKVKPLLDENKRTAYFLVDSLRYELAETLEENLKRNHHIEIEPAGALLPTKTALGMAALTPPVESPLFVQVEDDGWNVRRGDTPLSRAEQRDKWFKSFRGDRCVVMTMEKWLSRRQKLDETVDLLVVRHADLDAAGHNPPGTHSFFGPILNDIAKGIRKALSKGFEMAVVATDHGALYLPESKPGDKVSHPRGNILYRQDRYAFGSFEDDPHLFIAETEGLGYASNVKDVAVPAVVGAFDEPGYYMHGGLSLQEALIPVMTVRKMGRGPSRTEHVEVSYKGKARGRATTRTPAITISVPAEEQGLGFEESWAEDVVEILVTVQDEQGTSVGSVPPNENLDPSSGILRMTRGSSTKIPITITEDFSGSCTVQVHNPVTMESYGDVQLDIDILE